MADLDRASSAASASTNSGTMPGFGGATDYEDEGRDQILGVLGLGNGSSIAHNEAIDAWKRSEMSADAARNWDKYMQDTQFQRKVRDYLAAGFSPLAALEGSGNYAASSAAARSDMGHPGKGGNILGLLLSALIGASSRLAAVQQQSQTAQAVNNAKVDAWRDIATMRSNSAMAIAKYRENAWRDRYGAFKGPSKDEPDYVSPEELEKALRKAFPNG